MSDFVVGQNVWPLVSEILQINLRWKGWCLNNQQNSGAGVYVIVSVHAAMVRSSCFLGLHTAVCTIRSFPCYIRIFRQYHSLNYSGITCGSCGSAEESIREIQEPKTWNTKHLTQFWPPPYNISSFVHHQNQFAMPDDSNKMVPGCH